MQKVIVSKRNHLAHGVVYTWGCKYYYTMGKQAWAYPPSFAGQPGKPSPQVKSRACYCGGFIAIYKAHTISYYAPHAFSWGLPSRGV